MSTNHVKKERTNTAGFNWIEVDQECQKELSLIHQRWLGYCEGSGVPKEVYNPVMIAICSAVFDYLMQRVANQQKGEQVDTGQYIIDLMELLYIPEYLKYRDMGHMYFPAAHFIPFIKNVDKCVLSMLTSHHSSSMVLDLLKWQQKNFGRMTNLRHNLKLSRL